jgi:hypothetical protein
MHVKPRLTKAVLGSTFNLEHDRERTGFAGGGGEESVGIIECRR